MAVPQRTFIVETTSEGAYQPLPLPSADVPEVAKEALRSLIRSSFSRGSARDPAHGLTVQMLPGENSGKRLALVTAGSQHSTASFLKDDIAGVLHDVKNPIGALLTYTEALLETPLGATLNSRQREVLSRMRRLAVRSLELLKNSVALTAVPTPTSLVFASLCQSVVSEVLAGLFTPAPVLSIEESARASRVRMSAFAAERVITNLVVNACTHGTPDQPVLVTLSSDGATLSLSVSNGSAHPFELDRVHEAFFSAPSLRAGSGVGTAVVKTLVAASGGTLTARFDGSKVTVTVTLPCVGDT